MNKHVVKPTSVIDWSTSVVARSSAGLEPHRASARVPLQVAAVLAQRRLRRWPTLRPCFEPGGQIAM